jgi:SAM-dependent methyltransferase
MSISQKIRGIIRRIKKLFGIYSYLNTSDRQVLQTKILPYFAQRSEFFNILFVGTAWYTEGYKITFKQKNYWTIEIDPSLAKHGARNHLIDSIENVDIYFQSNELDVIICNGVFGWGLNQKPNIENTFTKCFNLLREGGILVLGWNDIPERRPILLEESQALNLFKPFVFPPLSTSRYLTATENNHTFSFYIKQKV